VRIQILDEAEDDLQDGRDFYDRLEPGVGDYFAAALASDINSLILFAGIHPKEFGFHRSLSKRFPFGIYYLMEDCILRIYAVLDLRRNPAWIRRRLNTGERQATSPFAGCVRGAFVVRFSSPADGECASFGALSDLPPLAP
jgi:hypothetical protein